MRTQKLILSLVLFFGSVQAKAAFEENARRYMGAQEIIQSLSVFFRLQDNCKIIQEKDRALLGLNSPNTGNPLAPAPTQSTVQWIASCIQKAHAYFRVTGQYPDAGEKLKTLIGSEVYAELDKQIVSYQGYKHIDLRLGTKWSSISAEIQNKLVANMVFALLGSDDVINDFGLIDPNVLRAKLAEHGQKNPEIQIHEMILFISVNLAVRDEFLSY